jgi:type I restriction enzyme R subunit
MSKLLDEIIAARKAKAIEYEEYLKRIAELAKKVQAGQDAETPPDLNTPGRRAIFNWLKAWTPELVAEPGPDPLDRALMLDAAIKRERSDGWRGVLAREQEIKRAMYNVLGQETAVEALFPIVKQQREY